MARLSACFSETVFSESGKLGDNLTEVIVRFDDETERNQVFVALAETNAEVKLRREKVRVVEEGDKIYRLSIRFLPDCTQEQKKEVFDVLKAYLGENDLPLLRAEWGIEGLWGAERASPAQVSEVDAAPA